MNIFLIGYRCTGKTTVGRSLAGRLGWPFIDADVELVKEHEMTVSQIVSTQGWDAFREKETAVIKKLSGLDKHVIATGGGAVLNNENIKNMKKNGVVVWLRATPEIIRSRMAKDEKTKDLRPSLTSKGLHNEIEATLLSRKPFYENAMDFCVDTDDLCVEDICSAVINNIMHSHAGALERG
ncbi:MAG: shikimate kinase [Deltaproteobacteria bacterium]|nr:shikimate kinase [Deltaproteobacteria bacterium]MBW2100353.1 shikimate kinase [Deltaproteobacteria bacterium]